MPRAAELARERRLRRRAALDAERERAAFGYTVSDAQLQRPTRDGTVWAVQSRPLGTLDLSEPFQETAGLRRGDVAGGPRRRVAVHEDVRAVG